ncbi:MAG TPA: C25 family cysteine peptidase [Thermoanaerobaculia bacterium]|nr:C25 family cysteine peptidase [Thermoanaerobaculia bacterium]
MTANRPSHKLRSLLRLALFAVVLAAIPADAVPAKRPVAPVPAAIPATPQAPAFKIFLSEPGVYRVSYEDLVKAGLEGKPESETMGLTNRGRPVPIWIDDAGDGQFGPGDHLEFIGDRLAGAVTYYNEHSNLNVYRLRLDAGADGTVPARMSSPVGGAPRHAAIAPFTARQHFEHDSILLRFPGQADQPQELWFWAKLTQQDAKPFRQEVDLSDLETRDLDPDHPQPVRVTVEIRGWSQPARKAPLLADHAVEIWFGGKNVATKTWNNPDGMQRVTAEIPAASVAAAKAEIEVRIPVRENAETGESLIDVAVLNSIEVNYPRSREVGLGAPVRVEVAETAAVATFSFPPGQPFTLYGEAGTRIPSAAVARIAEPNGRERAVFLLPHPETVLWAVPSTALAAPVAIERDKPSAWAKFAEPVDYLIIAHPRLLAAIEPLAELHRKRGLKVAVIDVEDLYDEWNGGILDPQAIKDFLRHAWRDFPKPAPRFVLLVGDASWDPKNLHASEVEGEEYVDSAYNPGHGTEFAKIISTPYSERGALEHRNLVPTWNYGTFDGHAAGDNWFVDVEDDDLKPEMAIGRLPVVEPEEVAAIVEKTAAYLSRPELGPWRRDVLWVTNEEPVMQGWSDEMARDVSARGFSARKVYPQPQVEGAPAAEADQKHLVDALSQGEVLVHFIGHGGRFIWRTGPPDWTKHRDLFNLADLDRLPESRRLPLILSMTCYSAPFDHPTADSIGEKFLRLPKKGAIAVIAASWRNSPYKQMSETLIKNLLTPGATIGEALLRTKHESHDDEFVRQYNLLGDPALPLAIPEPLKLAATAAAPSPGSAARILPTISARRAAGEKLAGEATVDWLDENGAVLATERLHAKGAELDLRYKGTAEAASAVRSARVYLWDTQTGRDAAGAIALPEPAAETPSK